MEKKIDGHIAGFETLRDMQRLEEYYDEDFTDAGMSNYRFRTDTIGKEECDRVCEEFSGEVIVYQRDITE